MRTKSALAIVLAILSTAALVGGSGAPAQAAAGETFTVTARSLTGWAIAKGPDGNVWATLQSGPGGIVKVTPAGAMTFYQTPGVSRPAGIAAGPDGNLWFTGIGNARVGRITPAGVVSSWGGVGIADPTEIAAGPDGNLWFTNAGNNSIGRITPTGTVANFTDPGIAVPQGITAGPDGNVWFTSRSNGAVGRVTPAGTITMFTGAGTSPSTITAGPDGNVWFAGLAGSSLYRITPAGVITPFPFTLPGGGSGGAAGLDLGADGALWFASSGRVVRMATDGTVTSFAASAYDGAYDLATGPDGNLWLANGASIGRMTPTGVYSIFRGSTLRQPYDLTTAADGSVWYVDTFASSIGKVLPYGYATTYTHNSIRSPRAIVRGPDDNLWFLNNESVGRITPAGVVSSFTGPGISDPRDLTVGPDGNLWFTNNGSNSIGRVTPAGVVTNFPDVLIDRPNGITTGPDGALWFTNWAAVGRITTAGVVTLFGTAGISPLSFVATGADGNLWFTDQRGVSRLTPAGVQTRFAPPAATAPRRIRSGPDGKLYFVNAWSSDGAGTASIARLSLDGTMDFLAAGLPAGPRGLTFGADGRLWAGGGNTSGYVAVLPLVPAAPPAPVYASPGDGLARLAWFTPAGPGVTGYAVTPYIGGVAQPAQLFDAGTAHTITGLVNGTTYTFGVAATNGAGAGPQTLSGPVTVGAPNAPPFPFAEPGFQKATITWFAPPTNGAPITGYTITPKRNGVAQVPIGVDASTTTWSLTGLVQGDRYTFDITATNARGTGPASTPAAITVGAPSPPRTPTAVPGNGTATVSYGWPLHDNGAGFSGWTITPYIGAVAQPAQFFGGNAASQVVTGLTNGTSYTFKITAHNMWGDSLPAGTTAITVGAPVAPGLVSAQPGIGSATVSWWAPTGNGSALTGYTVTPYLGATALAPRAFDPSSTTRVISGLANGGLYTFKVTATNARGTSPTAATPAIVVGAPSSPTGVGAVAGVGEATVSWTAPAANASAITGYRITPYKAGVAQPVQVFGSTATSQLITGLSSGVSYRFVVAATNGTGTGPGSPQTTAVVIG